MLESTLYSGSFYDSPAKKLILKTSRLNKILNSSTKNNAQTLYFNNKINCRRQQSLGNSSLTSTLSPGKATRKAKPTKRNAPDAKAYRLPEKFSIRIQAVESLEPPENFNKNKEFLTADAVTNTSIHSKDSQSSEKSNSRPKKISSHPARHLSGTERENITKCCIKKSFDLHIKPLDCFNATSLDKQLLANELLFRKFRKHRIIKKMIKLEEESWEWSSYGSASPARTVRFKESN